MNLIQKLKRKKQEKWYEKERIPALDNALRDAVYQDHKLEGYINNPFRMLAEHFLGCGLDECYTLNVVYPSEVDMHLMSVFEQLINKNFTCCNNKVAMHLRDVLDGRGLDEFFHFRKYIGFSRRFLMDENGAMSDYISSGTYFIENSAGIKIALQIATGHSISPFNRAGQFGFDLYVSSNDEVGKEACSDFIRTMNIALNSQLRESVCALGTEGIPVMVKRLSWDDLKIPRELKNEINFHIMNFISRIESFKKAGIKPSRGIIISGSPGNGKTMLGKILCSNMGVPFFIATADDFKMGVNNQKIEKLYITASMYAPSIVYIEDADIFLQQRQYNLNGFTLSGFLNLIDGLKENTGVITIITCNSPELLDEAVKNRPKRFDVIIEFPNPALEQRIEILQVKLKEHIKEEDSDYLSSIAGKMHGFSGAHITEFADRLIMSKIYSDIEFVSRELMDRELENFSFRPSGSNTIGLR